MEVMAQNPLSEVGAYGGKPLNLPMWLHDPAAFSAHAQGRISESAWAKLQGPRGVDRSRSCPSSRPGSGNKQRGQTSIAFGTSGFSLDRLANRLGMPPQEREAEMRRLLRYDATSEFDLEVEQQSQGRHVSSVSNRRPRSGSTGAGNGARTPQHLSGSRASPEPPCSVEMRCAACDVAVASKAEIRELPCGHLVHWRCLNKCMSSKGYCPACNPGRQSPASPQVSHKFRQPPVSPQANGSAQALPLAGRQVPDATLQKPRSVIADMPVLSEAFADPPGRARSIVDEDASNAVLSGAVLDPPRRPRSVVDENAAATVVGNVSDSIPPRRPSRFGLPVPPPVEVYAESVKDMEEVDAENAAKALLAGLPKPQENKPDWRVKAGDHHAMRAGKQRSTLRALAAASGS
eukprot:gnl/MRDRNA2_/MRDRNA2_96594_c0_seq1.p1 gnl/MRDRNA2_/MRDRNA2_96594_c0~~gnl/MRDRNA2_/MRDRNA2_96594_c0_seq1.p1  ORF type:complete len:404 (+),score=70.39 gnl/MRDRNA2_/MRDRNA2_96594_c0_seq1:48-1259(+)